MAGSLSGRSNPACRAFTVCLTATLVLVCLGLVLPTPAADAAGLNLVPDPVSPERGFENVTWEHTLEEGQHLVFHYSYGGWTQAVVRVVDPAGNEVMHAYTTAMEHYISDGLDADGEVRYKAIGAEVTTAWQRGDVILDGDVYTYHVDQREALEARTFTNATTGSFANASTVLDSQRTVEMERARALSPGAAAHAFRTDVAKPPWSRDVTMGEMEVEVDRSGHLTRSRLEVKPADAPIGRTALRAPAPSGPFVADASFHAPSQDLGYLPSAIDHQAVLAGVSGSEIAWALVMAPTGVKHYEWSLFFIDEERTRTQVAPAWTPENLDEPWHAVRAYVNPSTGTVEVQVDDAETAKRFTSAFEGPIEQVATGDVWEEDALWTGGGRGYYDDLALYPVDTTSSSPRDNASISGELVWYTPHDTPWSDWTVEAGSSPTIVEESWGPTLSFGSGTDDPALVSPELGDWDQLSTWFRSKQAMTAKNALLYEALDDQGEVLFRLGIEAGVLEAWHPGTHTSIDRLPAYILGSAWHRLVFIESHDGIEVHLDTGTLDIPLDPGDDVAALRVGSTGDDQTSWQLAGLRVTQGPVLAESFGLPALDPRLVIEHPEHGGDSEHRNAGGHVAPGQGSIRIEGSGIPDERAMVAAPIDDEPLVAETSFKVDASLSTHIPDHQAVLGGLSDETGSPGEAIWAVTVASLFHEGLRTDPEASPDRNPVPRGEEPLWGLYIDDGSGPPALLATFAADGWRRSHVLTAELDPATNSISLTLDRQPLASATVGLASTDWLALGDVSTDGLPLATRTGGSEGDILHGSFFIAGAATE